MDLGALGVFILKNIGKTGDHYHLKSGWNAARTMSVSGINFVSYVGEGGRKTMY